MVDKEEITLDLAEAAELMNKCVDTDINSQQQTRRDALLYEWNEASAHTMASDDGTGLSCEHMHF